MTHSAAPALLGNAPARVVVDLDAIADNANEMTRRAEGASVLGVVKGDAYGHGLVPSARAAVNGGATWLGVAQLAEAMTLRRAAAEGAQALDFIERSDLKFDTNAGERGRMLIELVQSRPACDVNGIIGGYTGEGTQTVIAGQASAKVSFRLVGDQDPAVLAKTFEAFVRERIPADCSVEVICYKGSRAISLPFDMPEAGIIRLGEGRACQKRRRSQKCRKSRHMGPVFEIGGARKT